MNTTAPKAQDRGWQEQPLQFDCQGETLTGVLSSPTTGGQGWGVLVVVGGRQYRCGAHRRFVHLARGLASAGHPVLRFDLRGMGDSSGDPVDFQTAGPDIAAALSALLQASPGLRGVVLWGLCDGASAALLHLAQRADPRVAGLCLVNPWVRTAAVQAAARVQHYYRQRLLSPAFWRKLLRGGVGLGALRGWWQQWRLARSGLAETGGADDAAPFPDRMAHGLRRFQGPTLCLLSGQDHTAREFEVVAAQAPAWQGLMQNPRFTTVHHAQADHTHSGPEAGALLLKDLLQWLHQTGLHSPAP